MGESKQENVSSKIICKRCHDEIYQHSISKDGLCPACEEIKELQAENKRLREENRWIPVSERLPKFGQYVLLYFPSTEMVCEIFYSQQCNLEQVTHWKPIILPE